MNHEQEGELLYKTSCDSCGSSDANAVYSTGTAYCFSCRKHSFTEDNQEPRAHKGASKVSRDLLLGEVEPLKARGIPEDICRQYNYKLGKFNNERVQIATYYDIDKQPVAQKVRNASKDFVFLGEGKKATLFGQQLFASGGKSITITEGEIDALSVATAFGGKYPVVSLPKGAAGARRAIADQMEYLCSFEQIVIWFDNDRAGREALEEVVAILPLDKVKIASHVDYKDANELLLAKGAGAIVKTYWGAESYKPDGFVNIDDDMIEDALKPIEWGIPWMYDTLTDMSYGRRYGEIVLLGAGVSVGKTDFLMQQIAFDLSQGRHVATFMLEQMKTETLLRIAGKVDGVHYHLPDSEFDKGKLKETLVTLRDQGLHIYDNFGRIDWETIKGKIRSAAHSFGCRLFYIDNLTALNAHADDERRNLDGLMEEIASLAKELDIWILLVSHLNPPKKGAPHESGGKVEQGQFTGSRSIMRWSQFMLGIERNTVHEVEEERSKGIVRVIKDRFSGKATGKTVSFVYDCDSGVSLEAEEAFALEVTQGEGDF